MPAFLPVEGWWEMGFLPSARPGGCVCLCVCVCVCVYVGDGGGSGKFFAFL